MDIQIPEVQEGDCEVKPGGVKYEVILEDAKEGRHIMHPAETTPREAEFLTKNCLSGGYSMESIRTNTGHMKVQMRGTVEGGMWLHGRNCCEAGFLHKEGLNPAERRAGGLGGGGGRRLGGFMVTKKEGKARFDVGLMRDESYRKKEVGC